MLSKSEIRVEVGMLFLLMVVLKAIHARGGLMPASIPVHVFEAGWPENRRRSLGKPTRASQSSNTGILAGSRHPQSCLQSRSYHVSFPGCEE